ncbi:pyrophosphatase PpaX [Caldalkalibacillus uzonensis]|uniref:Pyrophosphatase PpaX n=1 Tax=Caldalkalibacillus uzonensis TaxID=353224 RepID=A0ABU0CWQ4_9BACI|nr:pyrophosphatase PpaX [Caldalkalibacillus uzonensis]MDQ0340858.1 pyrophosphatase PpaX [Caldalkalibacillus uzonensis]
MTYKTVLFDLDGTLLDTNELILTSFVHTLSSCCPDRTFAKKEIVPHMGKPLVDMMAFFKRHYQIDTPLEEMVRIYREHNIRTHNEMVTAFPHVPEVVKTLAAAGITMGVVTTKQRNTAQMGLDLCDLAPYMGTLVSIEDVKHPKPHPEPVYKAMKDLGAAPRSTIMIGDSRYDIEAAQYAGIASAGVSWTLKGEDHLRAFSPTFMLNDMRDLLDIVGVKSN